MRLNAGQLAGQCVGCGLCASLWQGSMRERNGFMRPDEDTLQHVVEDPSFCPVMNLPSIYDANVWGRCKAAYLGWSNDASIREDASSGGIITSLLCHLLDTGEVDAVMQVGPSSDDPLFSEPKVSHTSVEIISNCGSRYVSCDGLGRMAELLDTDMRFAVVGRPCEIRAMRLLMESDERFASRVEYLLSFFCMGAPSRNAVRRLDQKLNPAGREVTGLKYRGGGWPGFATETFADGEESRITYDESWGDILGRDLESYCRFCFDGIGEYADVSAGDAWYQNEDGTPDFSEHDGRNVIFARTEHGKKLLDKCVADGCVHLEPFSDWEYLSTIQKSQFERKVMLATRLKVFRLMGKRFRSADISKLGQYSRLESSDRRMHDAVGLAKRIIRGRVHVP